MADNGPPAWSYFLGALVALGFGVFILVGGNVLIGVILLVAGLGLAIMGIQAGRRSLAALPTGEAASAEASAPTPLETRERAVGDYTDEAAVRGIEKPKRLCPECNSPVLPKAAECPTCGSAL